MGKSIPRGPEANFGISDISTQPVGRAFRIARKVPEVTVFFWIIKLLTTALGESTSDYLVYHIDKYVAVILGVVALGVAIILQLYVRRYIAWIYWLAVAMVAVVGTMIADIAHIVFDIPYLESTIGFSVVLAVVFIAWYASEKTLSIHSIYTPRRELFYWATVMATFALGTAAGDLTAAPPIALGYLASGVLYAVLFALPALGYWFFGLNPIVAFWFAYIMTRPLGASFADYFGKPIFGGLGLGDARVSLVLALLIVAFVAYLTVTRKDIPQDEIAMRPA